MPPHESGPIPRGIEVLVKKAAVDAEFKTLLLEKRADAASDIGLELDAAEAAMLDGVPASHLVAIIEGTTVDERARPAFLGRAAAVMIAALGVSGAGCSVWEPATDGIRPDRPPNVEPAPDKDGEKDKEVDDGPSTKPDARPVSHGVRPDRP